MFWCVLYALWISFRFSETGSKGFGLGLPTGYRVLRTKYVGTILGESPDTKDDTIDYADKWAGVFFVRTSGQVLFIFIYNAAKVPTYQRANALESILFLSI